MARVQFTLRIDAKERAALRTLSKVEGRTINQLLNEAINNFLRRRGRKECSLEAQLAALRAYRKQNPDFQQAMEKFEEAEATIKDPLEGGPVEGQFVQGRFKPAKSAQKKIRELLSA
jgi:hypothetical protein